MTQIDILSEVAKLIEPIIQAFNMEIVDIDWKTRSGTWNLCVYIDKPGGVGLKDCEAVHYEISDLLDRVDPIPHSYVLEVSSPGIERPLKKAADFKRFCNHPVRLQLVNPVNNRKKVKGFIREMADEGIDGDMTGGDKTGGDKTGGDKIVIETNEQEVLSIPLDNIKKANIMYDPDFHKI